MCMFTIVFWQSPTRFLFQHEGTLVTRPWSFNHWPTSRAKDLSGCEVIDESWLMLTKSTKHILYILKLADSTPRLCQELPPVTGTARLAPKLKMLAWTVLDPRFKWINVMCTVHAINLNFVSPQYCAFRSGTDNSEIKALFSLNFKL